MAARGKGAVPASSSKKAAGAASAKPKSARAAATVTDPELDAPPAGGVNPGAAGDESPTAASDAAAAAALAGEPDPEPTEQSGPEPEVDFEAEDIVNGREVPVYNPLPVPQTHQHGGLFHTVRAHGVDAWSSAAAKHAVGLDNEGGVLSLTGLRRLFGPEPRFQAHADEAGVTLAEYVERRNEQITAEADAVGAGWAAKHGLVHETDD